MVSLIKFELLIELPIRNLGTGLVGVDPQVFKKTISFKLLNLVVGQKCLWFVTISNLSLM